MGETYWPSVCRVRVEGAISQRGTAVRKLAVVALVLPAMLVSCTAADEDNEGPPERPPAGARLLSEIVLLLERDGYDPIVEIEFEDGVWEAEAFKDGQLVKIELDPISGVVRPEE